MELILDSTECLPTCEKKIAQVFSWHKHVIQIGAKSSAHSIGRLYLGTLSKKRLKMSNAGFIWNA